MNSYLIPTNSSEIVKETCSLEYKCFYKCLFGKSLSYWINFLNSFSDNTIE